MILIKKHCVFALSCFFATQIKAPFPKQAYQETLEQNRKYLDRNYYDSWSDQRTLTNTKRELFENGTLFK